MFGRPYQQENRPAAAPARRAAGDVARIQGGGLVQVIVTALDPILFYVFLNDTALDQVNVDSLFVSIQAPGEGAPNGEATATLSHYVKAVDGQRTLQQLALFPCAIEIVALDRRIFLTCPEEGTLDGLWISLGLKPDGTDSEVQGARALQILLNQTILDAKLTWGDGQTEELFPR